MNIEKSHLKFLGLFGILTVLVAQYYYFGIDNPEPIGENHRFALEKQGETTAVEEKGQTQGVPLHTNSSVGARLASPPIPSASVKTPGRKIEVRRLESVEKRKQLLESIQMANKLREMWKNSGLSEEEIEDKGQKERGTLSRETIRAAVDAVIEDVKTCYDRQLEDTPDLWGKIVVDFVIVAEEDIGGVVDSVEIGEKSDKKMRDINELVECIAQTIYTLELPEPKGSGQVDVSYPLIMRPGGD